MKKPRRITKLEQIRDAAYARRSVVVPSALVWAKPRPAAFMLNISGGQLLRLMERGMYLYTKGATNDA